MTRAEFELKFGDRIAGLLTRGFRQSKQYDGDAAQEGRAIKVALMQADQLVADIMDALIPAAPISVTPSKPPPTGMTTPTPAPRRTA